MILRRLKYGSVFSAVEIVDNAAFHFLSLKKSKTELDIQKKQSFMRLSNLLEGIKGCKHLFLVINNRQVLSKKIEVVNTSQEVLVKTAFPNISMGDFYFDVLDCETFSIVSICRKEVVDDLIDQFSKKGISVIDFSLGNTQFKHLLPFLNNTDLQTSNGVFQIKEGKVLNWIKRQDVVHSYDINGLQIDSSFALSLAGILSYYNGPSALPKGVKSSLIKEFNQKRVFQLGLQFGLGFLFIFLLINTMLFGSYSKKLQTLKEELLVSSTYSKQIKDLDRLVNEKKRLVEGINAASNSKVLWYFDRIAQSVPNTILLDGIRYQPVVGSVRKEKQVVFINDEITISGLTKDETDFTHWTSELEKLGWIKKVSIKDIESKNSKFTEFEFVVHLDSEAL